VANDEKQLSNTMKATLEYKEGFLYVVEENRPDRIGAGVAPGTKG
jgi:hypothetical protein